MLGALLIAGLGFGVNHILAGEGGQLLSEQEAAQLVEERYPGTVKEIELDDNGARPVYELELHGANGEYEIKMDARTGEILKVEQSKMSALAVEDDRDDRGENKEAAGQPVSENRKGRQPIGYEQAKKIALSKFSGKIVKIELDEDDGRLIYEVEMKKGKREAVIEIDAYTGKILFMSLEDDDDDDD